MLKKKWRDILIIAVCVVVVAVTATLYSVFASEHIFTESSSHLGEIYDQVNKRILVQIESERALLKSWDNYIGNSMEIINDTEKSDEERDARKQEFKDFLYAQQREWKFSYFCFIRRTDKAQEEEDSKSPERYKYQYLCMNPVTDEPITMKFRRSLRALLDDDTGGVVGSVTDANGTEKRVVMFAIRLDTRTVTDENPPAVPRYMYGDFQFASIGICFEMDTMLDRLGLEVFENKGECYITLGNGDVLFQSGGSKRRNYLDFLRSGDCKADADDLEKLVADWHSVTNNQNEENKISGTILIRDKTDNTEKYLTYRSVGFGGWMLVGVMPSDIVNGSMSWFRTVTVIVMACLFVFVAAMVAWILISGNRRRVKAKEVEIESRENLLDLLTENTNDMFVLFTSDTFAAEYVSANIKQVLGLDIESVRQDVRRILDAAVESLPAFTQDGLQTLPLGETWETDVRLRNVQSGVEYWFKLMVYHSVYDGKDSWVMMFSDRTAERKMNADLEDAFRIAKSANEAKSNFLSNMSHDIRTPMNAIIGFTTLLAKDAEKPDKVREYVRKIAYSGQHLLSLINDILDMSKIESGKTSLNTEEFNFSEFLEELYAMMAAQTKSKHQSFEMHTRGVLPEWVVGDKMRLNQILLNLLSNAAKYTPERGKIDLMVESINKHVHHHAHLRISVKDNGIGMSEEFVKEIFEPFSRETKAATKEIQGTGLGMAITKNIVDLMGGTISVTSEPNKGSTFVVEIELPVGENGKTEDKDFWQIHNVTHVLVIDDEEEVCIDIRELMCDTGVSVDYALSGKRGIEMVTSAIENENDYHIVLIDWKMPGMDGVETARLIRKKVGNDIPIMVLTSFSFDEIEDEAKAAGIDYFMAKPFFVSNFRNAISQIRDAGKKEGAAPETIREISLAGLKVLAAEDNEINAEILCELLDIEEVQCEIAENGQQALDKFNRSKPGQYDMIFMDIQMPVMNGYEAARAIRASEHPDAKTIPIIAMTANAFDDDVKAALDAGMDAHLAKPIDMGKLKRIIVNIREGKHAE